MRITRVYVEAALDSGRCITLPSESSHYLHNVMRLREGDRVHVFNAESGEFTARVASASKRAVELELGQQTVVPATPRLRIHLGLGLSRGDRMDYGIQKSTELGVTAITPLISEYSEYSKGRLRAERVQKKLQHWQRVAIAASEQSGRIDPPLIQAPVTLQEWPQQIDDGIAYILDPLATASFDAAAEPTCINLLVGPEGGFSEDELAWARTAGFRGVSLGPRILRTETAPVAALAILQYLYGTRI